MANNAAYIGFTKALAQMFTAAGIEFKKDPTTETGIVENAKWVDFQFVLKDGAIHKLYVPKNKGQVGKCHTTVEFPTTIDGVLELPRTAKRPEYKNGAIRSHLSGNDPERIGKLMIAALRTGAPVPQKRPAQPRQQQPVVQAQSEQDQEETPETGERESWAITEADVGQVDAELFQRGVTQ